MRPRPNVTLPPPVELPLLSGRSGRFLLRPWFDRVTIRWVTRVFFPISRAWAAARAAEGSREAFLAQVHIHDPPKATIDRLLDATQRAEARYQAATREWLEHYFAGANPAERVLAEAESQRERAAQNLMAMRAYAVPLRLRRKLPRLNYHIVDRETVAAAHDDRLGSVKAAFPTPNAADIEESHPVHGEYGAVSWLRWPSPMGDTAWARVYAPTGASDPPTLIYLHGIGMEMEMWRAQADPVNALASTDGIRVVRPEGPWHGKRMLPGYHGGEPALAFAPKGYMDLIQAWVIETAQLIHWARATSRGPVAIGGLSLGALTAQVVGTAARVWPEKLRPEVMFLICTCGDILRVAFEGSFARGLSVTEALTEAGWTHEELARYRGLLEPQGDPVMPAENLVMLLGRHDSVTPYSGGLALARRWGVPHRNLFIANRGHFSTPLGLHHDDRPLRRAVEVLKQAAA